MIFTPRLLTSIWNTLNQSLTFRGNPDAPSVEQFVAHYTSPGADPGFAWSDRATNSTYLYDLTINQLQVTPAGGPQASEVDRANDSLWHLLPPNLLEENPDWRFVWTEALGVPPTYTPNPEILWLVMEQGVDVKPFMRPAEWMKVWTPKRGPYEAKATMRLREPDDYTKLWLRAANAPDRSPYTDSFRGPNLDLMRLVLELGFDVHALMQPADWARMWERVAAIPQPETMRFVVEEGFGVRQPGDWARVWEQAVRALNVPTLRCVLKQGFDARTVMQPADWAAMWARATDPANAPAMRFILEQGVGLDALMPPADLKKVWFKAAGSDEAVTRLLLKHGYDVNTRDDWGRTALFHASDPDSPRPEVIHALVEAGITLQDAPAIINYDPTDIGDKFAAMDCRAIASYLEEKVAEAEAKRLAGAADAPPAA